MVMLKTKGQDGHDSVSDDSADAWGPSHIPFDEDTLEAWKRLDRIEPREGVASPNPRSVRRSD